MRINCPQVLSSSYQSLPSEDPLIALCSINWLSPEATTAFRTSKVFSDKEERFQISTSDFHSTHISLFTDIRPASIESFTSLSPHQQFSQFDMSLSHESQNTNQVSDPLSDACLLITYTIDPQASPSLSWKIHGLGLSLLPEHAVSLYSDFARSLKKSLNDWLATKDGIHTVRTLEKVNTDDTKTKTDILTKITGRTTQSISEIQLQPKMDFDKCGTHHCAAQVDQKCLFVGLISDVKNVAFSLDVKPSLDPVEGSLLSRTLESFASLMGPRESRQLDPSVAEIKPGQSSLVDPQDEPGSSQEKAG